MIVISGFQGLLCRNVFLKLPITCSPIRSMKSTLQILLVGFGAVLSGCGTKVTHEAGPAKADEAAGVEIAVRSGIKGQIASNIVQATDNVREMTHLIKEDVTGVTGKARLVAGQVSVIADTGVDAGVYLTPRAQVQWEYRVVSPAAEELEAELNHLGDEGWELFSERKEEDKTSYIFKRRRS